MTNRFDYVTYDEKSVRDHEEFKLVFVNLEKLVDGILENGRAKSLVYTKLEEAYFWVSEAIRGDQLARNGSDEA